MALVPGVANAELVVDEAVWTPHFGVSAGVGTGHGIAGIQLEIQREKFGLFLGIGAPTHLVTPHFHPASGETANRSLPGLALGARWPLPIPGQLRITALGFVSRMTFFDDVSGDDTHATTAAGVTLLVGRRFYFWDVLFLDVGIGPTVLLTFRRGPTAGGETRTVEVRPFPDVDVAVGAAF